MPTSASLFFGDQGRPAGAGAQQFREQFESAMAQNETLLALDDAEAASKDATTTEVADLADQVGKVSVADVPNGKAAPEAADAVPSSEAGTADAAPALGQAKDAE